MRKVAPPSAQRFRTGVLASCVLLLPITLGATAGITSQGCVDRRCEPAAPLFINARAVGDTRFETVSITEEWADFSHQRMLVIKLPSGVSKGVTSVLAYVSPTALPTSDPYASFALAAGNLAVVSVDAPDTIRVRNDTCADYFARVVIDIEPVTSVDGGSGTDVHVGSSTPDDAAPSNEDSGDDASL